MLALRTTLSRAAMARTLTQTSQRRSAQTVPKLSSEAEMKKEAISHFRARIARQKEIEAGGHSHAEEVIEMNKWIKISIVVALPACVLLVVKDVLFEEHQHRPEGPLPDYMKIRNKEFPWECEDCALFDNDCWKKCKEDLANEAS